ncbi:double-strand break repair helicase AddA [Parerythrobacter aestuarii]|uniref:double-strand break repair helicase AddA n=1 Tax=Parerythrobacter aestuarii TaxID=3020909 RepID=UPI0024DE861F|nr:double-strand break repair helicase AddA [Parerythrobacter aestuarii]
MSGKQLVYPLRDQQSEAVEPRDSVWLSASAGTGKTQVLSARVLRLLLKEDCEPESILCLTFTKAGAAEMATRVNEVLASWVRMDDDALKKDLEAIGARCGPEEQARARTLFAKVLDCLGGGLRIDTIHAFSQWILAAFPVEAELVPGTKAMEDREKVLLFRQVLSELLLEGNPADMEALADLSVNHAPDGAKGWLMRCAEAIEVWTGSNGWEEPRPLRERVMNLLELPADFDAAQLALMCTDDAFDVQSLKRIRDSYKEWGTKSGLEMAGFIDEWLTLAPTERLAAMGLLTKSVLVADGSKIRSFTNVLKVDPDIVSFADRVFDAYWEVVGRQNLLSLADRLTPALTLGRKFALAWDERKKRAGLIDFDDQIRRAAELLGREGLGQWINYKLDRQFDHILVDEAQDTNEAQWQIIRALTGEFFAGYGQHDNKVRTIFVVGDYKQAIFGFQGTSPENFRRQKEIYRAEIEAAIKNARELAEDARTNMPIELRELRELGLGRSFRTAQKVLDFVDAAIDTIGRDAIGLGDGDERHVGEDRPGLVTLWNPVFSTEDQGNATDSDDESWLTPSDRRMADRIAEQVTLWLKQGHPLAKGEPRNAGPGDIMVLVRKRRALAGLIVARLHAAGVPVAGVDRLRLGAPLAVKDLVAALRFAAQPLDDLNLANLLVSPLGEWSQEDLLEYGDRADKVRLWDHLRKHDAPFVMATVDRLRALLERVDFEPPESLLHWMLTGPWQGRRKLVARLGREANDPIDELLNAAFAYSSAHTASLAGFIHWFDAGDADVKRESGGDNDLVRVMTVHGSKGLQAPIVILADAVGNPKPGDNLSLSLEDEGSGEQVPVLPVAKKERVGRILDRAEAMTAAELEEHWRLLYVAMTRAEEALYVGGALGKQEKEPAPDSWYARLEPLMTGDDLADDIWGGRREWGALPAKVAESKQGKDEQRVSVPTWARTPIGPEPRPPRPLAPSNAGEDRSADPPLPPDQVVKAARRGVLIHGLLERLPDVPGGERSICARAWLQRQAAELSDPERDEILSSALTVIEDSEFAALFSEEALAEVPLAAIVGGQVIAGSADRLLITADEVTVIDFKTARRPPATLDAVSEPVIKQMAAYVAALEVIYPGRRVRAGVLYTHTPQLFVLPEATLAPHKAALQT